MVLPCQDICKNCQRHMLCKLSNPLIKRTLLVIRQSYEEFSTLRNKSSSLVLKPCKSIQEISEKLLFIKSRQITRQIYLSRFNDKSGQKLDRILTEISIEFYEIRISRSDFWPKLMCMCWVSFLTNLDIYKAYFKGRQIREYKENTCKK